MYNSARRYLFTSESVTEGHPDKVADQISDAVLDAYLAEDPEARVACETLVTTGIAFVTGEITSEARVDHIKVVRDTIKDIGYDDPEKGMDYKRWNTERENPKEWRLLWWPPSTIQM